MLYVNSGQGVHAASMRFNPNTVCLRVAPGPPACKEIIAGYIVRTHYSYRVRIRYRQAPKTPYSALRSLDKMLIYLL